MPVLHRETACNARTDVILRDQLTTAFICPKWWAAAPGHVLVVPNNHHAIIYSIPDDELAAVYAAAKRVAAAMRTAYECEGTSRSISAAGGEDRREQDDHDERDGEHHCGVEPSDSHCEEFVPDETNPASRRALGVVGSGRNRPRSERTSLM